MNRAVNRGASDGTFPKGFRGSGIAAGLKSSGKRDLALIVNDGICGIHEQSGGRSASHLDS